MDLNEKYVYCKEINRTSSMLFEDTTLLPEIAIVKNGLALELLEIQRCGSVSWSVYGSWVQSLLRQKVLRLHTRLPTCKKNPALAEEVAELLQQPFHLLSSAEPQPKPAQKEKKMIENLLSYRLATVNKKLASELAITQSKCL